MCEHIPVQLPTDADYKGPKMKKCLCLKLYGLLVKSHNWNHPVNGTMVLLYIQNLFLPAFKKFDQRPNLVGTVHQHHWDTWKFGQCIGTERKASFKSVKISNSKQTTTWSTVATAAQTWLSTACLWLDLIYLIVSILRYIAWLMNLVLCSLVHNKSQSR